MSKWDIPEDPDAAKLSMLLTSSHYSTTVTNDGLASDGAEQKEWQAELAELSHHTPEPSHS